jgi:L-aspartate oxidase
MTEVDIRTLMWNSVGLFRERSSLLDAFSVLHAQQAVLDDRLAARAALDHEGWRRASLVTVASLIARAALRREESRGGHFRTDFPAHDDLKWQFHVSDISRPEGRHYDPT